MTARLRKRGRPGWQFRQLSQGRLILRLFLIGLLLLFLGFAGALQSGLSSIGAGQTELAYAVASLRNGASLKPIRDEGRYSYSTTADADLQHYFSLDPETGALTLRDGLRSLSIQSNPLSSFPYQIVVAPPAGEERGRASTKVISLYIHFLNCDEFLALLPSSSQISPLAQSSPAEADRILHCMQTPPW